MKKKGNKKMPRPRQEIIDNPIPTSLFMCYAAILLFGSYWGCNFKNTCKFVATPLNNKDVGIGLSMISCLGLGIFLFPFFFMD